MQKSFVVVVVALCILTGCGGCRRPFSMQPPHIAVDINAPDGIALEYARQTAQTGDTVLLTGSVYDITATFTLTQGVNLIGVGVRKPVMNYAGPTGFPTIQAEGISRIENISFEAFPGGATVAIESYGSNIEVINCDSKFNLVRFIGGKNNAVRGCLVTRLQNVGSLTPWVGVFMDGVEDGVADNNTILGMDTGLVFFGSTNARFEENIVAGNNTGVKMDTLTLTTSVIQYNCVADNGGQGAVNNFYNATTQNSFTPTGTGNIAVSPQIIGAGDYRLLRSSPCATAGKNGGPIGAREVRHVFRPSLSMQTPSGILPIGKSVEVLRIFIENGDNEVELTSVSWGITSTPAFLKVNATIVELNTGKTLHATPYPMNGASAGVMGVKIPSKTDREYSVYLDTSALVPGNVIETSLATSWEEKGQTIYFPSIIGRTLVVP